MADVKVYDCPPPYSEPAPVGAVNVAVIEQPCTTQPCAPAVQVMIIGGVCHVCKVGIVQEEFTACGICLGICFFPLGLVCCLLMRERRCNHCGVSFS
ncbi:brain protein I3-like isoform X2 [Portunus trituberculatus]|uniref:brain protein I3-like isoform X2 n=1 Tax=Portunus trituberculatus TaxID=210409 RepID=UPI001E1CD1B3|nr:brain protein I3-like isoform X2 [Portunus trituberculatus]XP_045134631.1 brain protein I3-like isoform X2 [Portunus trituberculatus]